MGKKPVLAIGLVWAGIALTGCNTCSSCRNGGPRYSAAPTFQSRNTRNDAAAAAPTMVGDAKAAPTPDATPGRLPDSSGNTAPKATGIEPASGINTGTSGIVPASAPALSRPTAQSSLRPAEERVGETTLSPAPAAPRSFDDGVPSRLTSGGEVRPVSVPPRPVPSATPNPTTATTLPTTTTPPAPPAPALDSPALPGKSLPPIAPSSFDNSTPPPIPSSLPGK